MSRLTIGAAMVRVDDGKKGTVQQFQGEPRIVYRDRAETLVASKSEKWTEEALDEGPMREEEKRMIALAADRMLAAFVRHEPHKYWEAIDLDRIPFDEGFVDCIVAYLGARK